MKRVRFPIRLKLTLGTLLPLIAAIFVCWLTGISIINNKILKQAQEKVRTDLNAAREIYLHEIDQIRSSIRFTSSAPYTAQAFARGDRRALAGILTPLLKSEKLDIFTAVDVRGTVLFRARNPEAFGDDVSREKFVALALKGEIVSGTTVISASRIAAEGADLARQAAIRAVPTPRAKPTDEQMERSGMFLVSASPVRDEAGNIVGMLYGGVLLNNNNTIVDKIKETIYEGVKSNGTPVGSATIFLDDIRIATNVLTPREERGIGTRLSEEVYNRVILKKEKWYDRAFVVKDWYLAAYEPILSLDGVPIGALYVGMLEKPYAEVKNNISLLFSAVLFIGSIIGLGVSSYIGSRLARPIRQLETVARRVAAGERDLQIDIRTEDEVGALAGEFNEMTRALSQREEEIKRLNKTLELKVVERTAQLEEKNLLLIKTQDELVRAEKLADIGMLAAGVAHEINNPMAIIRGNTELLQMAIPPEHESRDEVETIARQVGRVERIVSNLLKFASQQQKTLGRIDLHSMLDDILAQVGHQAPLTGITIIRNYLPDLPGIEGDEGQIRQVFTNLVLNAIQAMKKGGELTITSLFDHTTNSCLVNISDTGSGISPENLQKVFSPFFTTKSSGTGLGLSVSYGIIRDHGGTISVVSEKGQGTTFTVTLPLTQAGPEEPGQGY